jgi:phosphatidate cytidylyltransferase
VDGVAIPHQTLSLFAGVGAVLVVASLIAIALKQCIARGEPHNVIDNLNARIRAWWVIVLAIAIAFAGGRIGLTLLFLAVSFAALREFMALACVRGDNRARAFAFYLVLPAQYACILLGGYPGWSIVVPVYAFLALPVLLVAGGRERLTERAAAMQWGLMICVFGIAHVPALLTLEIPGYEERNLLLIAFLVLVTQASDVMQYVWGMLLGRRSLAPRISPSKTWEGLAGGVVSSTTLGASLYWITPFSPLQAALMALAINATAFAGGLVLSAIKREHGVKDWGRAIPGHGGMLDRVDSLAFAAPVFYNIVRFGWS